MNGTFQETTMADAPSFAKLVPGFDFLQGLVKNAGAALPSMGQWIAPTLDPQELEKRIDELKTVQFWLEQNARMIATTVQALEVQRMTLSTLQTMNVQMNDLRDAMKVAPVASMTSAAGAAASSVAQSLGAEGLMSAARSAMVGARAPAEEPVAAAPAPAPAPTPASARARTKKPEGGGKAAAEAAAAMSAVDPMQWWGALTKQFAQIATSAMKDTATDAAKSFAGAMMKQGVDAAGGALKKAVTMPAGVAQKAMSAASQAASATGAAAAAKKSGKKAASAATVAPAGEGAAPPAARKRTRAAAPAPRTKARAH
jgi:hypothetical protein